MNYLVTGATGFIGGFLVEKLAEREGAVIHVLVREGSRPKFNALCERLGDKASKLHPLFGDITEPGVISDADRKKLTGKIHHIFHLAAVYDMQMDDDTGDRFNIEGTRNVVRLANALGARGTVPILHHTSSIAVAGGEWNGKFSESMFAEGQSLRHPYFRTKYEAEKIVRTESAVPFRIYRPGAVLGHSVTGEIDKVDGPYYFCKAIQRISYRVPKWIPLLGIVGGRVPIAPVDYVVAAMDAIAHRDGLNGECFQLIQSRSPNVGEMLQIFLEAAHGPEISVNLELRGPMAMMRKFSGRVSEAMPEAAKHKLSTTIGVPLSVLSYAWNRAIFDDKNARAALRGSGVQCPELKDYAKHLWNYWETYLDYDRYVPEKLTRKLSGKIILITGASSGIGLATAKKLAVAGSQVILVARTEEKLLEAQRVIQRAGGEAFVYPCDLTDMDAIDAMAAKVLRDFGHVDVLVNNAGRSIRRSVVESLDRFHDYERTIQLNYFGAVRLINALLPKMIERRSGHIVNISSIGVLVNAARFSAYVASKAALDAFTRCLSAEVKAKNVHTTAIYMPLVRTPMIAPTKIYQNVPTWSPDDAAATVVRALVERPKSIATRLGTAASVSYALWPKVNDYVLSKGFELFPSSSAARSNRDKDRKAPKPSIEQVIYTEVLKGAHF